MCLILGIIRCSKKRKKFFDSVDTQHVYVFRIISLNEIISSMINTNVLLVNDK